MVIGFLGIWTALVGGAELLAVEDGEAFFEKNIRPILIQRCQSCHSEKSDHQEGGFLIDSREALLKGGDRGPAIVPGDVEKSLLIRLCGIRILSF